MALSREQRIKLRAERYAKGEMDLQTFFDLESIDEEPDDDLEDIVPETPIFIKPEPKQQRKADMTKEDFRELSLAEQQRLYDQDPEGIEALVKGED